jgi:hypothetical protein
MTTLRVHLPTSYPGRVAALALGAAMAVAIAGCGYNNPAPTANVVTDTLVAFALNGSPASAPAGFDLSTETVVRVDANLNFDFAFDVDSATGQALVYPVALLSDGFVGTRRVGMQRLAMPFDSVTFAFRNGYKFDSSYALAPTHGLMIVTNPVACSADQNPSLYGMIVIDSVNTRTRTIHFRTTIDPNCGFRSFHPGIPSF